jgi:hypothetical protein
LPTGSKVPGVALDYSHSPQVTHDQSGHDDVC